MSMWSLMSRPDRPGVVVRVDVDVDGGRPGGLGYEVSQEPVGRFRVFEGRRSEGQRSSLHRFGRRPARPDRPTTPVVARRRRRGRGRLFALRDVGRWSAGSAPGSDSRRRSSGRAFRAASSPSDEALVGGPAARTEEGRPGGPEAGVPAREDGGEVVDGGFLDRCGEVPDRGSLVATPQRAPICGRGLASCGFVGPCPRSGGGDPLLCRRSSHGAALPLSCRVLVLRVVRQGKAAFVGCLTLYRNGREAWRRPCRGWRVAYRLWSPWSTRDDSAGSASRTSAIAWTSAGDGRE